MFELGKFGQGSFGSSDVSDEQRAYVAAILSDRAAFEPFPYLTTSGVSCLDDRLRRGGLAGGSMSLALMNNYLTGNHRLSYDLEDVLDEYPDVPLELHADCAAMRHGVPLIKQQLTRVRSPLFDLQDKIYREHRLRAAPRQYLAEWALTLPDGYVDETQAFEVLEDSENGTVLTPEGEHGTNALILNTRNAWKLAAIDRIEEILGAPPLVVDLWRTHAYARFFALRKYGASSLESLAPVIGSIAELFSLAVVTGLLAGPDMDVYVTG